MIKLYKDLTSKQYEASLCMLDSCVDDCPEENWHAPVVNLKFCQVVFHALFFTDLYVGQDLESFRQQSFHRENEAFFHDYEELEDRPPQAVHDKPEVLNYLQHCRRKVSESIAAETEQTLSDQSGIQWLAFTRAEMHVSNIRHIQHHVAQLSLRLRIDTGNGVPWQRSGWRE